MSLEAVIKPAPTPFWSALFTDRRIAPALGLGFTSGIPFLLVYSTQSAWLSDVGISIVTRYARTESKNPGEHGPLRSSQPSGRGWVSQPVRRPAPADARALPTHSRPQ